MADVYVNILNEGRIPWLRKDGPLFGYKVGPGTYEILRRDPRVELVRIYHPSEAEAAKAKYLESKKEKETIILTEVPPMVEGKVVPLVDEYTPTETVTILTEPVEETSEDLEIDSILESVVEEPKFKVNINNKETEKVKSYTEEELNVMTKAQMKAILRDERGYTEGPYAGKYHDTLEMLKRKVLSTQ